MKKQGWKVGESIKWPTLYSEAKGFEYHGVIIEIDSNVAIVACADGVIRTCDI